MRCELCSHYRSSHGYGIWPGPCGVVSGGQACDCPGFEGDPDDESEEQP